MWLFIAFLAVPLIEIALFIQVGGIIGLGWTLAIVVLTALIGTWLVRSQGQAAMGNLRNSFSKLDDPTEPLAHGAMILFAGALLLTPGFFTDAVGFALLTPPVRAAVLAWARRRVTVSSFQMGGSQTGFEQPDPHNPSRRPVRPDVIDGEYTEIEPENRPGTGSSGWTRH